MRIAWCRVGLLLVSGCGEDCRRGQGAPVASRHDLAVVAHRVGYALLAAWDAREEATGTRMVRGKTGTARLTVAEDGTSTAEFTCYSADGHNVLDGTVKGGPVRVFQTLPPIIEVQVSGTLSVAGEYLASPQLNLNEEISGGLESAGWETVPVRLIGTASEAGTDYRFTGEDFRIPNPKS